MHDKVFKRSHVFCVFGTRLSWCWCSLFPQTTSREGAQFKYSVIYGQHIRNSITNTWVHFICASCISNYSRGATSFVCLELISVCADMLSFLTLIRDVATLWSSVSYGQMTWKVYKKNMNAFHLCMIKYSRGATYFVCLELDCLGVDVPFFISPLLGRGAKLKYSVIYGQHIRQE
jgi:hypothetical protein